MKHNEDEEDIFSQFEGEGELIDELLAIAPPTDPPPPKRYLPGKPMARSKVPYQLQQLAKDYTEQAFEVILEIMTDTNNEASTRLEAAKQVLDRGWGKPAQQINQQVVKYTMQDLEAKLLEHRSEMDIKIEEARRIELERVGQYLTVDSEVAEDVTPHSGSVLQDHP
jgi:hypothetical protein